MLDSVISAETVFSFERELRLDNYWKDQDILYEYESKIDFKLQGNSRRGAGGIDIHML